MNLFFSKYYYDVSRLLGSYFNIHDFFLCFFFRSSLWSHGKLFWPFATAKDARAEKGQNRRVRAFEDGHEYHQVQVSLLNSKEEWVNILAFFFYFLGTK